MEIEELASRLLLWSSREAKDDIFYLQWRSVLTKEKLKTWLIHPFNEIWNFYISRTLSKKNIDACICTLKLNNLYNEDFDSIKEEKIKKILIKKRLEFLAMCDKTNLANNDTKTRIDQLLRSIAAIESKIKQSKKRNKSIKKHASIYSFVNESFQRETSKFEKLHLNIKENIIEQFNINKNQEKSLYTLINSTHQYRAEEYEKLKSEDFFIITEMINKYQSEIIHNFEDIDKKQKRFLCEKFYSLIISTFNERANSLKLIKSYQDIKISFFEKFKDNKPKMNFLSHSCKKHELHASIEFLRSRKVEAKMESSNYFKSANLLINKTRSSLLDFKQNLEQSILNLQTTKSSLDNLHASFLLVKRDGLQLNKISSNLMKDLYIINKEEEAPDFTPNFILTHNKDDKLVQVFSTLNYKPKIFDQQDITELIYLSAELFAKYIQNIRVEFYKKAISNKIARVFPETFATDSQVIFLDKYMNGIINGSPFDHKIIEEMEAVIAQIYLTKKHLINFIKSIEEWQHFPSLDVFDRLETRENM